MGNVMLDPREEFGFLRYWVLRLLHRAVRLFAGQGWLVMMYKPLPAVLAPPEEPPPPPAPTSGQYL